MQSGTGESQKYLQGIYYLHFQNIYSYIINEKIYFNA